eukprot:jgi/Botrbrau1/19546/Bobra.0035s0038.1
MTFASGKGGSGTSQDIYAKATSATSCGGQFGEIQGRDLCFEEYSAKETASITGYDEATKSTYAALMEYSPLAFASRKLEAAFLRDQDALFTAVCTYFWYLSFFSAGVAGAQLILLAPPGHRSSHRAALSAALRFCVMSSALLFRKFFPNAFQKRLQELVFGMRMYLTAAAVYALPSVPPLANSTSLSHFLIHFGFHSHAFALLVAAVTHPLRLLPNLAAHLAMLGLVSAAGGSDCTARLSPSAVELYLPQLGRRLGVPAEDATATCTHVRYRVQLASSMALVAVALMAELFQRRAFLLSRWQCLGQNGKEKAWKWPFGDPRGVVMLCGVASSVVGCSCVIWETFA